jgi:hypothetical protein
MELHILLQGENAVNAAIRLKEFIESSYIDGLERAKVDRNVLKPGEMGAGDLLGSITAIIEAAEKPLVELVKCLQKFVDQYTTMIIVPTKNGDIKLKKGRSMSAKELQDLVIAIQNHNNNSP